jgi:hypothetical protein
MANIVTGRMAIDLAIREVWPASATGSGVYTHTFPKVIDYANGTLDGQIDRVYSIVESGIGSAVTTNYDLAGSLKDRANNTITFAEVTMILLVNLSSTAANALQIGPGASNGFGVLATNKGVWADATDRTVVMAGADDYFLWVSKVGCPVTATTGDILSVITQTGTSANTWLLVVAGRSA